LIFRLILSTYASHFERHADCRHFMRRRH
jgi:hypothetical protein